MNELVSPPTVPHRCKVKPMPHASYVARLIALSTLLAAAPNVLAQGTQTGQASTESAGSTEELVCVFPVLPANGCLLRPVVAIAGLRAGPLSLTRKTFLKS